MKSPRIKLVRLAGGRVMVETPQYLLELRPSEAVVLFQIKKSRQRHLMFLGGACNPVGKLDETISFDAIQIERKQDSITLTISEKSSVWKSKKHVYLCRSESIEFWHEVAGSQYLDRCCYFRGFIDGEERGMCCDIDEIYSTAPNFQEKLFFHPGESFAISAGDQVEMPVGAQALASPCYCMGMHDRRDARYLSVGLADLPGNYTWDKMEWNPPVTKPVTPVACDNQLAGGFSALYDGKLQIKGTWTSPRLILTFAEDCHGVLAKYLSHCFSNGYLPRPPRRKAKAWWHEPIYCTWHDQGGLAASCIGNDLARIGVKSFEYCSQDLCEHWLGLLIKNHCKPGIVILDATWAKNLNSSEPDPQKWPDMRAWIDSCHERGVRVFVWGLAWAIEGLPVDECITRDGQPVACDVTNPKFIARFRENIRRWFSDEPGCLNADGIKLDGQLNLPTGKGLLNHGSVWGLELQKIYLEELYAEAKKHKADACISTFSLNPYLAQYTDMVRLADLYTHRPTARKAIEDRAALYRLAMPHAVIDTDGNFRFCMWDDYASEFAAQAELGIPTLYNAEWLYRARFFQPTAVHKLQTSDYKTFSQVIDRYSRRSQLAAIQAPPVRKASR